MGEAKWWQTAVFYQIYPRSFQDSTGSGVGDLDGITRRLDYLSYLGIDAVWISPFYRSPMADFGYDVSDYCSVDPMFGDLAAFDRLLAAAHEADVRVIIDWVPNHTSEHHEWFVASRSSRDHPKRDWYTWSDPAPDGGPPNAWVSVFGGSAWEWDGGTGQYYLHSFLESQPDLNWRNPAVAAAMLDTLRFWLDRGVDGFRMDVINFIAKDPELRDNPMAANLRGYSGNPEYDAFEHLHDKDHPDLEGMLRTIRAVLDSYEGDRVAVGEVEPRPWDQWVRYYGEGLDGLQLPFNFALIAAEWNAASIGSIVAELERALPEGAWPNYVLGNHDQVRMASRLGEAQARIAAMLLLTLRGTPTLYYGDEIGMVEADIPPEKQQDPWGRRVPGRGRDGCRTPMQWNEDPHGGFTAAHARPWLALHPDYGHRNVSAQANDPDSLLSLYRRLLSLRRERPALSRGDLTALKVRGGSLTFIRSHRRERLAVALNLSNREQPAPAGTGTGRILVATHDDRGESVDLAELSLRPDEGLVVAMGA